MSVEDGRRPKRQAAKNKIYTQDNVLRVNPALYVGYVEDLETPEMIMKKFQALEEYQAEQDSARKENDETEDFPSKKKKKTDTEIPLSEDDLQEVFRRTSTFSAASTILQPDPRRFQSFEYDSEGELLDDGWEMSGMVQEEDDNGESYYIFEDDSDGEWESGAGRRKGLGRRRARRAATGSVRKSSDSPPDQRVGLGLGRDRAALLKRSRRRKANDPDAIAFIRIPNDPIPSSWGKKILQYVPPTYVHLHAYWKSDDVLMQRPISYSDRVAPSSSKLSVSGIESLSESLLQTARENGGFNGVVLSPPWKEPRPGAEILDVGITPEDLLKLPLGDRTFLPSGFVYIWTPKHWLHRTLQALEKMDLHYVENAVVVNERVGDGPPLSQPCTYFTQQKETLLVCRRGVKHAISGKLNWEPIELRHQRISDVHLACFRPSNLRKDIPIKPTNYVYKMVETMLPTARLNSDRQDSKPRFCEVWSEGTSRSGWVFVEVNVTKC